MNTTGPFENLEAGPGNPMLDWRLASCWMCGHWLTRNYREVGGDKDTGDCRADHPWMPIPGECNACPDYICAFVPEALSPHLSLQNIIEGDPEWGVTVAARVKDMRELLGIPELDTVPDNEIHLENPTFEGWVMYRVPYREGDEKDGPRRIWVKCPTCTDEEIKIYVGSLVGTQVIWCTTCGTRFTVKHESGQTFYRLVKDNKHEGLEQKEDVEGE